MRIPFVLLLFTAWLPAGAQTAGPIRFQGRLLDFVQENDETPRRYAPETMSGGVATFDFDNDGHLDLFFPNGASLKTLTKTLPKHSNRLFRGDGKGNFTDVTAKAGLAGSGYDVGAAAGDFDNDGCRDLFVAGIQRNTLYRNNCDGTFADVTAKAGLATKPDPEHGPLWAVSAAWFDVENDGDLDLFIVNYLAWDYAKEPLCEFEGKGEYCHPRYYKGLPNQLFLNEGNGRFRDASQESGLRKHVGKGMGVGVGDFDHDGRQDLFVANDKVFNTFFHNRGNGKFEERAFEVGIALAEHGEMISGMGVDFRDIDNDGFADVFFVALDLETFPLFRNTGKGEFEEATGPSGMAALTRKMAGYGPSIVDFDNDGWKDLFVTRGHVQSPLMAHRVMIDQHNTVFRNLGNGKFAALTAEAGLDALPAARHRGSAIGDFNEDGRLDAVVVTLAGKAELWLNDSPGAGNWLQIELAGRRSNRDGAGARVTVTSKRGKQSNHVAFTMGYASSSATPLHFGLGPDEAAELVEVHWPSGKVQTLRNLAAGRRHRVVEPD